MASVKCVSQLLGWPKCPPPPPVLDDGMFAPRRLAELLFSLMCVRRRYRLDGV